MLAEYRDNFSQHCKRLRMVRLWLHRFDNQPAPELFNLIQKSLPIWCRVSSGSSALPVQKSRTTVLDFSVRAARDIASLVSG